jgi:hypothetical protein
MSLDVFTEANVPYPVLKDLETANPEFGQADVALVVGANDVTNPAAQATGCRLLSVSTAPDDLGRAHESQACWRRTRVRYRGRSRRGVYR